MNIGFQFPSLGSVRNISIIEPIVHSITYHFDRLIVLNLTLRSVHAQDSVIIYKLFGSEDVSKISKWNVSFKLGDSQTPCTVVARKAKPVPRVSNIFILTVRSSDEVSLSICRISNTE